MRSRENTQETSSQTISWKALLAAAALVSASVVAIYYGTLHYPFVFDDKPYIIENEGIRSAWTYAGLSGTRHLALLSFALNYAHGGLDPFGYHLFNTLVHAINGVLVFIFASLVMTAAGSRTAKATYPIAFAAAIIFTVHPVQTQAVTFITQRFTSLGTLFYLMTVILFISWRLDDGRSNKTARTAMYALALVSALLATRTKEISFTLPLMLTLSEAAFFSGALRRRAAALVPFYMAAALIPLSILLAWSGAESGAASGAGGDDAAAANLARDQMSDLGTLSPYTYLLTEFRVIITYMRLLALPINQNVDYDYPRFDSIFDPSVALSAVFVIAIAASAAALLVRSVKRGSPTAAAASFGVLWFFLALSVESSVIPIKDVIFEHRLYLPSVGAVLAFTAALWHCLGKERAAAALYLNSEKTARALYWTVIVAVAASLACAALERNGVWRSPVALYEDVTSKSPEKSRVHLGLGYAYELEGRVEEAATALKRAIELDPGDFRPYNNLGIVYKAMGNNTDALKMLGKSLEINRKQPRAFYNLGKVYFDAGDLKKAAAAYKEALRLKPRFTDARYNLGNVYFTMGDLGRAEAEYLMTLEVDPGLSKAHNNLGVVYMRTGRLDSALEEIKLAIMLDRSNVDAFMNLGHTYRALGMEVEAEEAFMRARGLGRPR